MRISNVHKGLGSGAIAGIVLGVLFLILVILGAIYVLRRYDISIPIAKKGEYFYVLR